MTIAIEEVPKFYDTYPHSEDEATESHSCESHRDVVRYILSGYLLYVFRFLQKFESAASKHRVPSRKSTFWSKLKQMKSLWKRNKNVCDDVDTLEATLLKLKAVIEKRQSHDSEELKHEELGYRQNYLHLYCNYLKTDAALHRFGSDRGCYMADLEARIVKYVTVKAMGYDPDELDKFPPFILDVLTNIQTTSLNVSQYCFNLYSTIVKVFGKLCHSPRMSELDPRYRTHFRASLFKLIDETCNDFGKNFWKSTFPPVSTSSLNPHDSEKTYSLSGPLVYEFHHDHAFNEIKMLPPFAPVLEIHQIVRMPALVQAIFSYRETSKCLSNKLTFENLVAMCMTFGPLEWDGVCEMFNLDYGQYMQIKAAAEADLTASCVLACSLEK